MRFRLARARFVLLADSLPQLRADDGLVFAGIGHVFVKNLTFVDHVPYQELKCRILERPSLVMLARFADPVLRPEPASVYLPHSLRDGRGSGTDGEDLSYPFGFLVIDQQAAAAR